jgi:membrane carboxypeptidase/penicillin-binding protein
MYLRILNKVQFPEQLIKATISIEDKRFYNHNGHDIISIFRAIINNFSSNRLQGASTIEQQFVRTILKNNEPTFKRKYFEITLSTLIFKKFTKTEIINLYLTCYTFHEKIKGVHSICEKENYKIDALTQKDIYEIAARFKYPTLTKGNYIKYLKRVRTVEIINNGT